MEFDNQNRRNTPVAPLNQKQDWPRGMISERSNTKNLWRLYYYMLNKSAIAWNGKHSEAYYFLSKNVKYWSQTKAAKDLNITPKTLKANLDRLLENHLIWETEKGYEFGSLKYYYPLHLDLINAFCSLDNSKSWELMIRFYSVLCYAFQGKFASFTLTDIIKTLGIGTDKGGNAKGTRAWLLLCLQWWRDLGLVEYKVEERYCVQTKQYYSAYSITSILDKPSEKMYREFIECAKIENEPDTSFNRSYEEFIGV